ncbi:hypothetical protein M0G43_13910 [Subsaxibacter sp. CAU 1640]|uniref:hypothetical protein n=1 Tax=Subsaxibacter sp. CAU 1640 TaxID=2933271 RepID=UPI002003A2DB|nr:hypothetical protein [Subsaxibacter sp. CAU 1640]MCK7591679.1 hypothetical protein [Subsaxibacter sp. CAU 1640]
MKHAILFLLITSSLHLFSQHTEKIVQPFLEDIVSKFPNVRDLALTAKNDEVIFSAQSPMGDISALVSVKKVSNEWSNPEVLPFSGRYFDLEPFFSNDGLTLYFVSNRPLDQTSNEVKDFDIWYVERASLDAEWSEPKNMGTSINTKMDEFYPVITASKNLYFTLDNPELKQKDDIYVSEFINGSYTEPKRLGDGINSDGYEFNAFVASDESYIIYTCYNRNDGLGSGDLYISKRLENGEWSPSENMGASINSDKMDYCPYVDEATNTLYFTSKRNALKPIFASKVDIEGLFKTFNSYENGLSRLYVTELKK